MNSHLTKHHPVHPLPTLNHPPTRYPSPLSFASHIYSVVTQSRSGQSTFPSYDSQISNDELHKIITTPVWAVISDHDDTHPTAEIISVVIRHFS